MACKGLHFKIQIVDLVQESPPQEKGHIRSGFQEATQTTMMTRKQQETDTRRTESTRGADKHIEAPHIHLFCSTFHLKNGPAEAQERRNRHVAVISLSRALGFV